MSEEKINNDAAASEGDSGETLKKRGINWADPSIPVGDAPPMPYWPVAVFVAVWVGWIVFLMIMLRPT